MPASSVYCSVPVSRGSRRVPEAQPLVENFIAEIGLAPFLRVCLHLSSLDSAAQPASAGPSASCRGAALGGDMLAQTPWCPCPLIPCGPGAGVAAEEDSAQGHEEQALTHLVPEGPAVWLTLPGRVCEKGVSTSRDQGPRASVPLTSPCV